MRPRCGGHGRAGRPRTEVIGKASDGDDCVGVLIPLVDIPMCLGHLLQGIRPQWAGNCDDSPTNQIDSSSTVLNPRLSYSGLPAGGAIRKKGEGPRLKWSFMAPPRTAPPAPPRRVSPARPIRPSSP